MPMVSGLDQYLAGTGSPAKHVMQVVTDPKAADVIMTDRIGEAFEQKMAELFPRKKRSRRKDGKKDDKTGGAGDSTAANTFQFHRGAGRVFPGGREVAPGGVVRPRESR